MNCTAQYSDVMYFGLDGPACWPSSRRRIDRVRYRQLCTSVNQGTNRLGWYYLILGSSSKAGLAGNAIETSSKHSGPTRILQGLKPRGSSGRRQWSPMCFELIIAHLLNAARFHPESHTASPQRSACSEQAVYIFIPFGLGNKDTNWRTLVDHNRRTLTFDCWLLKLSVEGWFPPT